LAEDTVRSMADPSVLDVGCGSGRIGEFALQAGASRYLGVDFSEPMIELSRERLARFGGQVQLLVADFATVELNGSFDVVLALGFFDYLPEPGPFAQRMYELCGPGGCVVGSFPAWSAIKGPVRKIRYEWINDCPIFNYSADDLDKLFTGAGFSRVEIIRPGRSGHLVRAWR
jgi:SAM-dependent methyltransferase